MSRNQLNKKRITSSSLGAIVLAIFVALPLMAAGWKQWNWTAYKVKFRLPATWVVGKNDQAQFYAYEKAGMSVRITPWKDKKLNAQQVAMNGYGRTSSIQNKNVDKQESLGSHNGFDFYLMIGNGVQKGKKVKFAMLGCIDPKSPVNVFLRFTWWDRGQAYNDQREQIAKGIARSFGKL